MLSSIVYTSLSLTRIKFEISLAKSVLIMIYIHNKFFFAWMEVQLGDLTKKEANLTILGGDIGVMYIIQDELLKSSSTQFAGVIARHPLTDELYMRVVSNNPLKDIIKATKHRNRRSRRIKKTVGF